MTNAQAALMKPSMLVGDWEPSGGGWNAVAVAMPAERVEAKPEAEQVGLLSDVADAVGATQVLRCLVDHS